MERLGSRKSLFSFRRFTPRLRHSRRGSLPLAWRGVAAVALVVTLLATGDTLIVPAVSAQPTDPATLINTGLITFAQSEYYASPAEQASLADLESLAVQNTLTDHDLPASDTNAAQTWGRDSAQAEMWALLDNAINKPEGTRTMDQENAVDWLQSLVANQNALAADDAGLEYAKWAGLGAQNYENELATSPSESDLQQFLSSTPVNYAGASVASSDMTPASTSNEGYCVYVAPANSSSYTGNIYTPIAQSTADQDCYGPCTGIVSCPPTTPSEQDFLAWGVADADDTAFDNVSFPAIAEDVQGAIAFGVGAVGSGLAAAAALSLAPALAGTLFAALITSGGVSAATAGLSAEALAAFGGELAATSVAVVFGVVIVAAAIAVIEFDDLITAAAIPQQLAQAITSPTAVTLNSSTLQDSSEVTELYSLFIAATLPAPSLGTCDDCLNAPPLPAPSTTDPVFTITERGSSSSTTAAELTWADTAQDTENSAFVSESPGRWWVQTENALSDSSSVTFQTLSIDYTNWSGTEEMAWLTGGATSGYQFLTTEGDASPPIDPGTCLSAGTCAATSTLQYVGYDGNDYSASLAAPSGVPTLPSQTESPGVTYTATTTAASFAPTTPETGEPVTFAATVDDTSCTDCISLNPDTPAGTITFVQVGTPDVTLCVATLTTSTTGTCTYTFTEAASYEVYAVYQPDSANSGDFLASEEGLGITVTDLAPTTTTLAATPSAPSFGQPVTYTATVADFYGAGPTPTGTVSFFNGSAQLCGPVTLSQTDAGENATCATSYSSAGPELVTAVYSGDTGTSASTGSLSLVIPQGPTTMEVSVPSFVVAGVPFPVGVALSTAGVPSDLVTGTVEVTDVPPGSSGSQCDATVTDGTGSCMFTENSAGAVTLYLSLYQPIQLLGETMYSLVSESTAALTVHDATVPVTVSGSQVYGSAAAPSFTYSSTAPDGITVSGPVTCSTVNGGTAIAPSIPVGTYTIDGTNCMGAMLSGTDTGEFIVDYAGATDGFVVSPATVPVTVSGTQTFGSSPTFSYSANLPTGITISGTLTCTTVNGGSAIAPSLAPGSSYTIDGSNCSGLSLSDSTDYTLAYAGATDGFVVSKAPITAAVSGTETFGAKPSFAYTTNGPAGLVSGTLTCSMLVGNTKITSTLTPGSYTLQATSCSGLSLSNTTDYTFAYAAANDGFVVSKAPTTVSLSNPLPGPVRAGVPVTYLAVVSKGSAQAVPTGTVTFSANGITIPGCSATRLLLGTTACFTTFRVAGTYDVAATYSGATDFASSSASLTQAVDVAPAFSSADHDTVSLGKSFSFQVSANGYPTPSFKVEGTLPKGVSFSSTGLLSGTPTTAGRYTFTIIAMNAAGTASQSFTLTT